MRLMAKATSIKEGKNRIKTERKTSNKTIRKIGNSLGLLLDNIVSNMGFIEGTPISVEMEQNKIIITPEEPRQYPSVIKYLRKQGTKLIPEFYEKSEIRESARFEDVYNNRTEQFTFLISYDHMEKNYLLIYAKKTTGARTVRYITEEVYKRIKEGKNPENYFVMKK
jgi:antitoxin component of MazEF toxin-antitoxin module